MNTVSMHLSDIYILTATKAHLQKGYSHARMHTHQEGYAYVHCLGRRSLAPQGDAGSYRCESPSLLKHEGCSQ